MTSKDDTPKEAPASAMVVDFDGPILELDIAVDYTRLDESHTVGTLSEKLGALVKQVVYARYLDWLDETNQTIPESKAQWIN